MNENVKEELLSNKPKSFAHGAVVAVGFIVVLAAAAGAGGFVAARNVPERAELETLEALERRVFALEKKAEESSVVVDSSATTRIDVDATAQVVVQRLKTLEEKFEEFLTKDKTRLETAVVLSVTRLLLAARTGAPFDDGVRDVRRFLKNDGAMEGLLDELEPLAREGVAPFPALKNSWRSASARAQAALRQAQAQTWQDKLWALAQNLVTVKTADVSKNEESIFSAIEQDVARGRISQALEKISGLAPQAQEALEDWRAQAKARAEVERLLDALYARLVGEKEGGNS